MAKKPCFPVLYHPAPDGGPGDPVAPEEWRQLRPYKGRVPEPPASEPGANHGQERDRPYGSQRARQFISTRTFQVSAKYASPPAPPGFQTPFEARSRLIDGSNEVEFNVSEMRPRHWHPSQIDFAYGEAKRILEYVGLDPNADGAWCWRQSQGTWWALSDADGNVRMDRDGDPPGAWWLPRRAGKPEAHGYAPEFMKELSYEFGALEWALRVLEFVDDLKGFEAQRRQEHREMGLLTSMPEWATLEAAIAKSGDCDLSSALYVFRSALTVGELPARLSGEFMMGVRGRRTFRQICDSRCAECL